MFVYPIHDNIFCTQTVHPPDPSFIKMFWGNQITNVAEQNRKHLSVNSEKEQKKMRRQHYRMDYFQFLRTVVRLELFPICSGI